METNVLHKIYHPIDAKLSDAEISNQITIVLKELEAVYSYLIRANYKRNELVGWTIEYNIAQTDEYNTLKYTDIIDDIVNTIICSRDKTAVVIGYKQPTLELMTKLYEPFLHRLAIDQSNKWAELEYEDVLSICWLVMTKLYRKGYYIHKTLLIKSLNNAILTELRHSRNKPEVVSLEKLFYDNGQDDALSIADTVPDTNAESYKDDKENDEVLQLIFNEIKDILIDNMGQRQFDQLFRDYSNKNTTAWSRKKMQTVKNLLNRMGISWNSFRRYYENY